MLIVSDDGTTSDLVEVPAPNELHLQEVIKSHPSSSPSRTLGYRATCWWSVARRRSRRVRSTSSE